MKYLRSALLLLSRKLLCGLFRFHSGLLYSFLRFHSRLLYGFFRFYSRLLCGLLCLCNGLLYGFLRLCSGLHCYALSAVQLLSAICAEAILILYLFSAIRTNFHQILPVLVEVYWFMKLIIA